MAPARPASSNLLSAYLAPDAGRILFRDRDVTDMSVSERIRAGIARSFQIANLFDDLSAHDHVALSILLSRRPDVELFFGGRARR